VTLRGPTKGLAQRGSRLAKSRDPLGPPRSGNRTIPDRLIVGRVMLARLMGRHPDRVTKYLGEGMPVLKAGGRGKESEFDAIACLAWERERRPMATKDVEQTRYYRVQADKIEQEIRKRAGALIEAAEVEHGWAGMVLAMRERLLSLPTTALQRNVIRPETEAGLIELVDEALSELSTRRPS